MDGSIERLIEGLEAKFDALLARDEEEAADDLAGSLERGMPLHERLVVGGRALRVLLPEGRSASVSVIGVDHLRCGSPVTLMVPMGSVAVAHEDGRPPIASDLTMSQALQPWAQAGKRVEVDLREGGGPYVGALRLVASDHLVLDRAGTSTIIPFEVLASIRLSPGG